MIAADSTDRALGALQALDAGCDRETWIRVCMSAKAAGLDKSDFINWSSGAGNFKSEHDCDNTWNSVNAEGGITAGTLFHMAREVGWRDDAKRASGDRRNGHTQLQQRPLTACEVPDDGARPVLDFRAVWRASEAATEAHPYIAGKLGLFDGLRVYRGSMKLARQALDGALLVPAYDATGALQSWQAIAVGGKKLNAAGASMAGAQHIVGGALRDNELCYIVEGIGAAWSAHQASGKPAVCCFGAGNMARVVADLCTRHPTAHVVIVADRGKEADAQRIATQVRGKWVGLPEAWEPNSDINDLHKRDGLQAVADLLAKPNAPRPSRFRFLTVSELLQQPSPTWRIQGVIPERGLVVMWGASGSGKTFAAIDMACAIARGEPWAGRRVRQGVVAYIAAEGQLRERVNAYVDQHGLATEDLSSLRVLDSTVNLLDPGADLDELLDALRALATTAGAVAVVIIDTLNRVMPGGDENSSEDMGLVVAAAKRIEAELACVVLFIHHSGKDESKGSRGHSSLKAATDAELSVKRTLDIRTVTAEKVRDGADGQALLSFRLMPVDLGAMADVDPGAGPDERRTSCVVEPAEATQPGGAKMTTQMRIAFDALRELVAQSSNRTPGTSAMPAGKPCCTVTAWRERFRARRGRPAGDQGERAKELNASRMAFERAICELTTRRIVGIWEDTAWIW